MNIIGFSGLHTSASFKKKELPALEPRYYRLAQGMDSAAALVTPLGIRAAAAEERFTREKGTGAFPVGAMRYCLRSARLKPKDIDVVAHAFAYEPVRSIFEGTEDPYLRRQFDEVYSRDVQLRCLQEAFPAVDWDARLELVPHHLAHAASSFYLSGFDESLILVVDGMGELHTTTVAVGRGDEITIVKQVPISFSLGFLYSVITLYIGFWAAQDEYKVMGLAPYGNRRRYYDRMMELVTLRPSGSFAIPILSKNRTLEEKETFSGTTALLEERFGPRRDPGTEITERHRDIAAALQAVTETTLLHVLRRFQHETGLQNLCMAGGVALNCTANGLIRRSGLFKKVFVQPAAGDDGSALGAALYVQRRNSPSGRNERMSLPLWGPAFGGKSIEKALRQRKDCAGVRFEDFALLAEEVAARLADGQVVAWFQGRMEFGPRALGSRSILADPRDREMRDRINHLVKKREGFRPFAPAVPVEDAARYFEIEPCDESTYFAMSFVIPVREEYRERLPAVTHVDGSARVQTVSEDDQPRFWELLRAFGKRTGIPVLLNTSLNVRGQPIVCTPEEAIDTFLAARLDALVLGDWLVLPGKAGI